MPNPLFHSFLYKEYSKNIGGIIYCLLPDLFAFTLTTTWKKSHDLERLKKFNLKEMIYHVYVDITFHNMMHSGILSSLREEIEQKLSNTKNFSSKIRTEKYTHYIMEASLDVLTEEKYGASNLLKESQLYLETEKFTPILSRFLEKDTERIRRDLEYFKTLDFSKLTSIEGILEFWRGCYLHFKDKRKVGDLDQDAIKMWFSWQYLYKPFKGRKKDDNLIRIKEIINETKPKLNEKFEDIVREIKGYINSIHLQ